MTTDVSKLAETRAREWELLDRVYREAALHPPSAQPDPEKTIVTISREFGACGHSVAVRLIEQLGPQWELWDREIVDAVAKSAKVRSELAARFDDKLQSTQESVLRYLTNYWSLKPNSYYQHLMEVLVTLSHQGHKVIVGRGANFVLPNSLKIRLCASENYRAQNVARQQELALDAATSRMHAVDRERADFVRAFFGRNIDDPAAYDLTLRMDHISVDTAVAAIAAAVNEHI
jgi:hypothetical protein